MYHHGVYFHGHAPPFSLIVRLVFQIHAMWLIYATEHHINLYAFTSETEEEEAMEHRSRSNMVSHSRSLAHYPPSRDPAIPRPRRTTARTFSLALPPSRLPFSLSLFHSRSTCCSTTSSRTWCTN